MGKEGVGGWGGRREVRRLEDGRKSGLPGSYGSNQVGPFSHKECILSVVEAYGAFPITLYVNCLEQHLAYYSIRSLSGYSVELLWTNAKAGQQKHTRLQQH